MKFNFFIGGFFGGHYELLLKKGALVCFVADYPMSRTMKPTHIISIKDDPDWETFLQYLQTIQWKEEYESCICDGTQWNLNFRNKGVRITSYGSNNYPPDFKTFLRLLNNVTSKHGIPNRVY